MRWTGITAKPREEGVYKGILPVMEQILRQKRNANILRFVRSMPCRACGGTRLRPEALAVTFRGATIAEAAALTIDEVRRFFEVADTDHGIQSPFTSIRNEVDERCDVLQRLGLGYLTLDRESTTLSARRGAARQAGGIGGHRPAGRALRARRALGRPASPRHGAAARRRSRHARPRQYGARGRARRPGHPAGRLDHRRRARAPAPPAARSCSAGRSRRSWKRKTLPQRRAWPTAARGRSSRAPSASPFRRPGAKAPGRWPSRASRATTCTRPAPSSAWARSTS